MDFEIALVRSGLVDADVYVEALSRQQSERPPLGQIALETGALSARQVREVLQAQSDSAQARFGELALSIGMLDRRDLAELLMIQNERQKPLVSHLVELGALTEEQARAAIVSYKAGTRLMEASSKPEPTPAPRAVQALMDRAEPQEPARPQEPSHEESWMDSSKRELASMV